jgi:hypothetical protein
VKSRIATRFLLGGLTEAERERVEEELLGDAEACEEVAAREDELIDAYLGGELGRRDRRAFEAALAASPRLEERVGFARALAAVVGEEAAADGAAGAPPERTRRQGTAPALRLAAVAAAVAVAVGAAWLADRSRDLRGRLDRAEAQRRELAAERDALVRRAADLEAAAGRERAAAAGLARDLAGERRRLAALEAELARRPARPAAPAPLTVSFVLSAALRSPAGVPALAVPAAAEGVRLDLDLGGEEPFASFLASLAGPGGAVVWSAAGLLPAPAPAGGPTRVALALPAALLSPGRYELRLSGVLPGAPPELVGAYEFRVVRP